VSMSSGFDDNTKRLRLCAGSFFFFQLTLVARRRLSAEKCCLKRRKCKEKTIFFAAIFTRFHSSVFVSHSAQSRRPRQSRVEAVAITCVEMNDSKKHAHESFPLLRSDHL
jgi:hypothetical protein